MISEALVCIFWLDGRILCLGKQMSDCTRDLALPTKNGERRRLTLIPEESNCPDCRKKWAELLREHWP